jgi:nucleoid-associated protein EbfC
MMKKGGGGGGMQGGMASLMRQANQLQSKIKKLQEELALQEYEGSSGGGAVSVKIKGQTEIISLKITEDVVKSGDIEMLQDLVVTATNDALKRARDIHAAEMEKVTGGFNLPGL